ncbi:MAG: glycine--tRNA ligase [Thaumarchaeota archaeon]|nr:glycine--tRNA ligase [Nitrososphaerota archaeon]MCL5317072.1 glycine--tRNA ligase [Nitrososphaerota archaeon]
MSYDDVMRLALERGFYVPSCEIYADAPAGFWDYGPVGTAFKNRFVELWRREVLRRDEMVEIDGSQIMAKDVFVASGHLENFFDPIVTCTKCKTTIRADRLISEKTGKNIPERLSDHDYDGLLNENNIRCPKCGGQLGEVSKFNMMFRVGVGAANLDAYLRPETCQSIFVDFPRFFKIMRGKLPFPMAQLGKSFRNEIAPRQSLMRLREFYQAEIEIFFNPDKVNDVEEFEEIRNYPLRLMRGEDAVEAVPCEKAVEQGLVPSKFVAYYLSLIQQFYEKAGIDLNRFRFRRLAEDEKAFYAKVAFDVEVQTSIGWIELVACNDRSDYDLKRHSEVSKSDMTVLDGDAKVLPNVFELSMGVDRSLYCILEHSLVKEEKRDVLKLKPQLAPIHVGVFPLVTKEGLPDKASQIYNTLKREFQTVYDVSGSIGRRYRRLDEIGTPLGITVDFDTLKDDTVTLRERDSMQQSRIKASEVLQKVRNYYQEA